MNTSTEGTQQPCDRLRYPRSARVVITCSACGRDMPHQAHQRCISCDYRWRYYGRPADGPPKLGQGLPPRGSVPHACEAASDQFCPGCDLNRAWAEHETYVDQLRERTRKLSEKRWNKKHGGHPVVIKNGRRHCTVCKPVQQQADDIAVARAVMGDPPQQMTPAEREAAVLKLRLKGLSYTQIANRVRCSQRTAIRVCKANGLTQQQLAQTA